MKKWLPWMIVGLCAVWLLSTLLVPADKDFAYTQFGRLPIEANGRIQPMDSLARNTLLQMRQKQTAILEPWSDHPKIISATEWLLNVMTRPELADTWPEFRIDNPDLKSLLGLPADPDLQHQLDGKHFSWPQIKPKLADLERENLRIIGPNGDQTPKTPYEQAVVKLWNTQAIYNHLKNALGPASAGNLALDFGPYFDKVRQAVAADEARSKKQKFDESLIVWVNEQAAAPLVAPPPPDQPRERWLTALDSAMLTGPGGGSPDYSLLAFNDIAKASRAGDVAGFNAAVTRYTAQLKDHGFAKELTKGRAEQYFNFIEPFYKAMIIYLFAFLLVLAYWFRPGTWDWLRTTAVGLVILALIVHTGGLLFRMILEGRPPVTNLYSSAIFIGWGATVLGLVLEKFWRNSIGVMVSCIIGFLTLIIAHHLRMTGDTMEMMRAVLDTNFWLATHVVVVTLGYASTFVAGVLGIIYIVLGIFTKKLSARVTKDHAAPGEPFGKNLNRMIYGIICFATLFSFVGTVLGGIWADQSWGRFWGWDPKENGALIIVLWNALVLHARWGGLVRERGLANMAVAGNIVTSWSWFGVNMLGIGLHSYGFTSAAFRWLILFVGSQLILVSLGLLPKQMWRSFQTPVQPAAPPAPAPAAA